MFSTSYEKVKISILAASKDETSFEPFCKSLFETCSNPENVEIIIKIDSINPSYEEIFKKYTFKYKILMYPFYERMSSHYFYNEMLNLSSGLIIWPLGTDFRIIRGDWYSSLVQTRGSYADNIYFVFTYMDLKNNKGKQGIPGAPAITREWCSVLKSISLMPNIDRWLYTIAKEIKRIVVVSRNDLLIHYPKGRRVMSKLQRKKIFFPMAQKACKKFKKSIK